MKKTYYLLCALIWLFSLDMWAQKNSEIKVLNDWLGSDPAIRQPIEKMAFARQSLTKTEAAEVSRLMYLAKEAEIKKAYEQEWNDKAFRLGDNEMKFDYRVFGNKPEDGRSLYISMHGGGGAPAELNDRQWYNQIHLYQPKEGVYVAPRAPLNTWDLWHRPHIDSLFEQLIQTAVVLMDVNPDKVYVMGYSAGGDGTFRLASRIADRWAAASMMAGHPGGVSPLNLRNIGFSIWMGALDGAYNRNVLAGEWKLRLDSLQKVDTAGYKHDVHIVKGKGHWMDRQDTLALPWMASFRRNPFPDKVVWRQEEVIHPSFYWLFVPLNEAVPGKQVIVEREGNVFRILRNDYERLSIGLNDEMIDFEKPVKILYDGRILFNGKVKRNMKTIYESVAAKGDRRLIFSANLTVLDNKKVL